MLSRVADSIYWMNRYVERAENVARFVSVNQGFSLGGHGGVRAQWKPLIEASGDEQLFAEHYSEPTERNVLEFLIFDERNPNSIRSCVLAARENGRMVRETLSTAMWEALNRFYIRVREATDSREDILQRPHQFLGEVNRLSHHLLGVQHATISQGEMWNFMRLGRLLERADKTSRILDVKYYLLLPATNDVGSQLDAVQWTALLDSTSALTMYRRRYGIIVPNQVAEFLILDRSFPRSIHHCVTGAERAVHDITGVSTDYFSNPAEQYLGKLRYELTFLSIEDVISQGMHQFVDSIQVRLDRISEETHNTFFSRPSQQQTQAQSQ
ncbi:alpha-E domain-containing protein [Adhaeretor mobilis]|uniref:DUF403 domain-containing protein n=1 Tax=Adhaeretor mobilis TaxID=1930276 RepID=A0A517MZJ6_9BACT|nr:alpha-E domain-containing protein [Adhaeretor mobilis]QDT00274.1 hypothetical protein HG15A2_36100 [Adhaeretor mobilis]